MKELTKKILEAGLVDKTVVQLLEKWHLLTPEEAALATKPVAVVEALEKFVENLEELLDREPLETTNKPMRETRLEILITRPPSGYFCPTTGSFEAVEDEMGRLICSPTIDIHRGDEIWKIETPSSRPADLIVSDVDKLYENDKVIALQITVTR
jgi:hypothetical protein